MYPWIRPSGPPTAHSRESRPAPAPPAPPAAKPYAPTSLSFLSTSPSTSRADEPGGRYMTVGKKTKKKKRQQLGTQKVRYKTPALSASTLHHDVHRSACKHRTPASQRPPTIQALPHAGAARPSPTFSSLFPSSGPPLLTLPTAQKMKALGNSTGPLKNASSSRYVCMYTAGKGRICALRHERRGSESPAGTFTACRRVRERGTKKKEGSKN
ncbi:hypothetical protein BDY21DRAFT_63974 [Lineolata rhizophorae]|uniref:Uncharacterized protein n=1 Tax=Lineolata rhizophorae TaxID=578093 RepID=A0A6A6NWJ1_9PEZI|nr:hypothetical protein BDY21DRAFT_63974 [Lineolata rhizophorae]